MKTICWNPVTGGALAAGLLLVAALLFPAPAPAVDATVHGLLDLVATGNVDEETILLNSLYRGDTAFDAYRLRVFADAAVTDRIQVHTQFLLAETSGTRAFGAYVTADPWAGRDIHLVAGEMPWLIGSFDPRSYSDKNPLIGHPMMYQYHTSLRPDQVVPDADALLEQAGAGNEGVNYDLAGRSARGMPIIYDQWWDFGAGVTGSMRPMEFAIGWTNGTPSYTEPARDENGGKSILGRLGVAPTAGSRFGISGAYGPYLSSEPAGTLPAGSHAGDYNQVLVMADAEWSVAHMTLRSEGYRNTWQTPTVGDLRVGGFYVEGTYTLPAGFYVAGRYEIMRFSDLTDSTGTVRPWDTNWDRREAGVGYRITRGAVAKIAYQSNLEIASEPGEENERYDLVAGQLSIRF
ncbi:MAG TPA: hypothetical protein VID50_05415 [Candidatus Eisenbacteria bacterium]|jgi:hypothetical protein